MVRRDSRKVADFWVINPLTTPRPEARDVSLRNARRGEQLPQPGNQRVRYRRQDDGEGFKADRFKDQSLRSPLRARAAGRGRRADAGAAAAAESAPDWPAEWLSDTNGKLYFTRQSRDLHKLDICRRRSGDRRGEGADRGAAQYLYRDETAPPRERRRGFSSTGRSEPGGGTTTCTTLTRGRLKNRITSGEYVRPGSTTSTTSCDALYLTAVGREEGEIPY